MGLCSSDEEMWGTDTMYAGAPLRWVPRTTRVNACSFPLQDVKIGFALSAYFRKAELSEGYTICQEFLIDSLVFDMRRLFLISFVHISPSKCVPALDGGMPISVRYFRLSGFPWQWNIAVSKCAMFVTFYSFSTCRNEGEATWMDTKNSDVFVILINLPYHVERPFKVLKCKHTMCNQSRYLLNDRRWRNSH